MSQVSSLYVKITTNDFQPMNMPVNTVWKVNSVLGKYLVAGGYAAVCNSGGTLITEPWPPTIQSGDVNGTDITLTYDIAMAVTDETGITVNKNGSPVSLDGVTPVAATGDTIVIKLAAAAISSDEVVVFYNGTTGNIVSDIGSPAASLDNYTVTNSTP